MRPVTRTTTLVVAGLLALGALAGCSGSDDAAPAPTPKPTTIGQVDPSSMSLVRVDFCDLVPTKDVTAALGAPAVTSRTWGNGEAPPLDGAQSDLAHEFGCAWSTLGRTTARAWVFARPVTATFGRQVIADGRGRPGCTTRDATTFGSPGALQECTVAGGQTRVRHAGLFGDTWLTCEVAGSGTLRARADAWCVAVANALDTQR